MAAWASRVAARHAPWQGLCTSPVAALLGLRAAGDAPRDAASPRRLFSSKASDNNKDAPTPTAPISAEAKAPTGLLGFLDDKRGEASPDFKNRWLMVLPAFGTHMCIGSPWGWSVMSSPLTRELGVVTSAAADWSFSEATVPLSITFAFHGLIAALAGKFQMRVGARKSLFLASLCFGGGFMLGGVGIAMHSLPLLYLGYGVLGGTGIGLGYTPPVQALLQWFPDRKGLASGLTIAGFGSAALIFTPIANKLMQVFAKAPTYLGPVDEVKTIAQQGKLFATVDGTLAEVVTANAYDISKLSTKFAEGVYVVGTGSTGAAETLMAIGAGYLAIMLTSALTLRRPHRSYVVSVPTAPGTAHKEKEKSPSVSDSSKSTTTTNTTTTNNSTANNSNNAAPAAPAAQPYVPVETVMRTPQFYMLSTTFFCLACGGMGIFSVAKPMMGDVFGSSLPGIVTAAFASSYVMALSAGNLSGRIGWALFFDKFGPRTTFNMFTLGSIPIYLAVPSLVAALVANPSIAPLAMFTAATVGAISFMGGTYALLPAYEANLFGATQVGAIHGRVLLASTVASLVGPTTLLALRSNAERKAIEKLMEQVSPEKFESTFGESVASLDTLLETKTVTISKLLALLPPSTPDPTPFIYDTTFYALAGLASVAAVAQFLVRPVRRELFVHPK